MTSVARPALCILVMFLTLWAGGNASGQSMLHTPELIFEGLDDETVIVVAKYYDDGREVKTISSRAVVDAATPMPLEPGHAGVRVWVAQATHLPIVVSLVNADQTLDKAAASFPQTLQLAAGKVGVPEADFEIPRYELSGEERGWVMRFFASLAAESTAELVSPARSANIQWQVLDAYCEVLNEELGPLTPGSLNLEGWLGWEGSLGARVLSGNATFENGSCRFTLMIIDEKLVDVTVDTRDMPRQWFDGPTSEELYVQQAEQLARQLFTTDAEATRELFSPRYFEDVTVERVAQLMGDLRKRFGKPLEDVEFQSTTLAPYNPATRSRHLDVRHVLEIRGGKQAVATTRFVFPCGPNIIGRGELAAINISETWSSAQPQQTEIAWQAVNHLFSNASRAFLDHLHEDLRPLIHEARLEQLSRQLADTWGNVPREPDWTKWVVVRGLEHLTASGPLETDRERLEATFHFSGDALIGMTLLGSDFGASTLDLIQPRPKLLEQGQALWANIFSGRLESAYQSLAPAFREQLPLQRFEGMVANSNLGKLAPLKRIEPDRLRVMSRVDRSSAVALVGYYVAEFEDSTYLALQCEFVSGGGAFELVGFKNDFDVTFPVENRELVQRVVTALLESPQAVQELTHPSEHAALNLDIVAAFQAQARHIVGDGALSDALLNERVRVLHDYSGGVRRELLHAVLQTEQGELPFDATLQFGFLKSFFFTSQDLSVFAHRLRDIGSLEDIGHEFVNQWLKGGRLEVVMGRFVEDLRREAVLEELKRRGRKLLDQHGKLLVAALTDWSVRPGTNEIECWFDLEFEDALLRLEIVFELTALDGKIRSIRTENP